MDKNNKSHIDTYETIYPVHIVVANKYTTLEELKNLYCYSDKEELDDRILDGSCTTSTAKRKSDNHPICLIKFNSFSNIKSIKKDIDLVDICAHEACHAALDIQCFIGEDLNLSFQEPIAYLTGYIATCIYKTLKKK